MESSLGKRGPQLVQSAPGIPEGAFLSGRFSAVHTVVLCAELQGSLDVSAALPPQDYDALLNEYQHAAFTLVEQLRAKGYAIAETHVLGDQLRICFYDPDEVSRNFVLDDDSTLRGEARHGLIEACSRSNRELTFHALKTAIQLKHLWLQQAHNVERVKSHCNPWELRIALHYGWSQLATRADGTVRAEGHTVNVCRHLLATEKATRYSGILVSSAFHDAVRSTVIKHTQLRQRVFFAQLSSTDKLHELKFCHRIGKDVELTGEEVNLYEAVLNLDQSNIWAYYELAEHYASKRDWHKAFKLAKQAQLVHPDDEKVLLDLAKYYLKQGKLEQSREFAQQALQINRNFDLAHEHLSQIAALRQDFTANAEHWRSAVRLTPGSPLNNFNLGLAMLCTGREDEGFHYIQEAIRIYPEYAESESFIGALQVVRAQGQLPEILESYLDELVTRESAADSRA